VGEDFAEDVTGEDAHEMAPVISLAFPVGVRASAPFAKNANGWGTEPLRMIGIRKDEE